MQNRKNKKEWRIILERSIKEIFNRFKRIFKMKDNILNNHNGLSIIIKNKNNSSYKSNLVVVSLMIMCFTFVILFACNSTSFSDSTYSGTTLTLTGNISKEEVASYKSTAVEIIINGTLPSDCSYLFSEFTNLTTVTTGENFNSSNVTDMNHMFYNCRALTELDLTSFDTSKVTDMNSMFYNCWALTPLDVSKFDTSKVTDMNYMFYYCYKLTTLDVSNFDTSKVTDMHFMFANCQALTTLDVSKKFDTSNVTDMNSMFYNCIKLTTLDVSKFDTSNVTYMNNMFQSCKALTTLNLTSFDTSNVTDMNSMFYNCIKLTTLDVSKFDTSNVTYMNHMFYYCQALTTLNLTSFDTSNVTDMNHMFYYCQALTTLNLTSFDTSNVTYMHNMFENCVALTTLDVTKFDTSKVTDMNHMFQSCRALTPLDVSKFDTSKVTDMNHMFYNCTALTTLDVTKFDTSNVTSMSYMFQSCNKLTTLDVTKFDTSNVTSMSYMFENCVALTTLDVTKFDTSKVTNMNIMFNSCKALTTLDLTSFDTSSVKNMERMFVSCINLTNIYVSDKFVVDSVTNSENMFYNCSKLPNFNASYLDKTKAIDKSKGGYLNFAATSFDLCDTSQGGNLNAYKYNSDSSTVYLRGTNNAGQYDTKPDGYDTFMSGVTSVVAIGGFKPSVVNWLFMGNESLENIDLSRADTSNVTDMSNMFKNCKALTTLDVSKFDTSNVTDMNHMFYYCNKLTTLDVSKFDTSNVTDMKYMFYMCDKLTTLDVSKFDTSKVTDMRNMFAYCKALTTLDVSKFDTSNVTDMRTMFQSCQALTTLDLTSFDTSNVTAMMGMFQSCTALTTLYLTSFDTSNVTDMNGMFYMFYDCKALTTLDLTSFDTSNVTDMMCMFKSCQNLTNIYVSDKFVISQVTNSSDMFTGCSKLPNFNESYVDKTRAIDKSEGGYLTVSIKRFYLYDPSITGHGNLNAYKYTSDETTVYLRGTNNAGQYETKPEGYDTFISGVTTVVCVSGFKPANINGLFNGANITTIDLSGLDLSQVTSLKSMFEGASSLSSIDLSGLDTSNVTNITEMFKDCTNLTSIDLSGLNLSSVQSGNSTDWLSGCTKLTEIILPNSVTGDAITLPNGWWKFNGETNEGKALSLPAKVQDSYDRIKLILGILGTDDITITNNYSDVTYKGSAYEISELTGLVLTNSYSDALVCGTDFTASFKEGEDLLNVGEKTIVLTGINRYAGSCETTVTINPYELTIDLNSYSESLKQSKTYDGTNSALNKTLSGIETGAASEKINLELSGTYASSNAGTCNITYNESPVSASISDAESGIDTTGSNYTFSISNATRVNAGTINQKAITIDLDSYSESLKQSKDYDGTNSASNKTLSGIETGVASEKISIELSGTYANSNAGTCNITYNESPVSASISDAESGIDTTGSNYTLSISNATRANAGTINQKAITIDLDDYLEVLKQSKTYDGTNSTSNKTLSEISTGVASEKLSIELSGTYASSNAGTCNITYNESPVSASISDAENGIDTTGSNYTLTISNATRANAGTISPKSLTLNVNGIGAVSKTYDGLVASPDQTISPQGVSGEVLSLTVNGTYDNKNVGSNKEITWVAKANSLLVNGSTAGAANYSYQSSVEIGKTKVEGNKINPKAITLNVDGITKVTKTYDGNLDAGEKTITPGEAQNGEVLSLTVVGTFDNKDVNDNKTITWTVKDGSLLVDGSNEGATNYSYTSGASAGNTTGNEITKLSLNIDLTDIPTVTKVYDNSKTALWSGNTTRTYSTNGVSGETINITVSGLYEDENVGNQNKTITYSLVSFDSVTGSNNKKENYTVALDESKKSTSNNTIEKRTITSADFETIDTTSVVYNGDAHSKTVTNKSTIKNSEFEVVPQSNVNAGEATLTIKGKGDNCTGSFDVNFTITPFTITPEMITVTESNIIYDAEAKTPSFKVEFNGDELTSSDDYTFTFNDNVNASNDAKILVTGKGNFAGTNVTKTFTINPRSIDDADVTVEITPLSWTGTDLSGTETVKVFYKENLLSNPNDYTYALDSDTTSRGERAVTINGFGNFTGTRNTDKLVIFDNNAPELISDAVIEGGVYSAGDTIDITLTFSENVISSGTNKFITISLDKNAQDKYEGKIVSETSGEYVHAFNAELNSAKSHDNVLVFTYTVKDGDYVPNGVKGKITSFTGIYQDESLTPNAFVAPSSVNLVNKTLDVPAKIITPAATSSEVIEILDPSSDLTNQEKEEKIKEFLNDSDKMEKLLDDSKLNLLDENDQKIKDAIDNINEKIENDTDDSLKDYVAEYISDKDVEGDSPEEQREWLIKKINEAIETKELIDEIADTSTDGNDGKFTNAFEEYNNMSDEQKDTIKEANSGEVFDKLIEGYVSETVDSIKAPEGTETPEELEELKESNKEGIKKLLEDEDVLDKFLEEANPADKKLIKDLIDSLQDNDEKEEIIDRISTFASKNLEEGTDEEITELIKEAVEALIVEEELKEEIRKNTEDSSYKVDYKVLFEEIEELSESQKDLIDDNALDAIYDGRNKLEIEKLSNYKTTETKKEEATKTIITNPDLLERIAEFVIDDDAQTEEEKLIDYNKIVDALKITGDDDPDLEGKLEMQEFVADYISKKTDRVQNNEDMARAILEAIYVKEILLELENVDLITDDLYEEEISNLSDDAINYIKGTNKEALDELIDAYIDSKISAFELVTGGDDNEVKDAKNEILTQILNDKNSLEYLIDNSSDLSNKEKEELKTLLSSDGVAKERAIDIITKYIVGEKSDAQNPGTSGKEISGANDKEKQDSLIKMISDAINGAEAAIRIAEEMDKPKPNYEQILDDINGLTDEERDDLGEEFIDEARHNYLEEKLDDLNNPKGKTESKKEEDKKETILDVISNSEAIKGITGNKDDITPGSDEEKIYDSLVIDDDDSKEEKEEKKETQEFISEYIAQKENPIYDLNDLKEAILEGLELKELEDAINNTPSPNFEEEYNKFKEELNDDQRKGMSEETKETLINGYLDSKINEMENLTGSDDEIKEAKIEIIKNLVSDDTLLDEILDEDTTNKLEELLDGLDGQELDERLEDIAKIIEEKEIDGNSPDEKRESIKELIKEAINEIVISDFIDNEESKKDNDDSYEPNYADIYEDLKELSDSQKQKIEENHPGLLDEAKEDYIEKYEEIISDNSSASEEKKEAVEKLISNEEIISDILDSLDDSEDEIPNEDKEEIISKLVDVDTDDEETLANKDENRNYVSEYISKMEDAPTTSEEIAKAIEDALEVKEAEDLANDPESSNEDLSKLYEKLVLDEEDGGFNDDQKEILSDEAKERILNAYINEMVKDILNPEGEDQIEKEETRKEAIRSLLEDENLLESFINNSDSLSSRQKANLIDRIENSEFPDATIETITNHIKNNLDKFNDCDDEDIIDILSKIIYDSLISDEIDKDILHEFAEKEENERTLDEYEQLLDEISTLTDAEKETIKDDIQAVVDGYNNRQIDVIINGDEENRKEAAKNIIENEDTLKGLFGNEEELSEDEKERMDDILDKLIVDEGDSKDEKREKRETSEIVSEYISKDPDLQNSDTTRDDIIDAIEKAIEAKEMQDEIKNFEPGDTTWQEEYDKFDRLNDTQKEVIDDKVKDLLIDGYIDETIDILDRASESEKSMEIENIVKHEDIVSKLIEDSNTLSEEEKAIVLEYIKDKDDEEMEEIAEKVAEYLKDKDLSGNTPEEIKENLAVLIEEALNVLEFEEEIEEGYTDYSDLYSRYIGLSNDEKEALDPDLVEELKENYKKEISNKLDDSSSVSDDKKDDLIEDLVSDKEVMKEIIYETDKLTDEEKNEVLDKIINERNPEKKNEYIDYAQKYIEANPIDNNLTDEEKVEELAKLIHDSIVAKELEDFIRNEISKIKDGTSEYNFDDLLQKYNNLTNEQRNCFDDKLVTELEKGYNQWLRAQKTEVPSTDEGKKDNVSVHDFEDSLDREDDTPIVIQIEEKGTGKDLNDANKELEKYEEEHPGELDDNESAVKVFDINIIEKDDPETKVDIKDGKTVTVEFELPSDYDGKKVNVYVVDDEGNIKKVAEDVEMHKNDEGTAIGEFETDTTGKFIVTSSEDDIKTIEIKEDEGERGGEVIPTKNDNEYKLHADPESENAKATVTVYVYDEEKNEYVKEETKTIDLSEGDEIYKLPSKYNEEKVYIEVEFGKKPSNPPGGGGGGGGGGAGGGGGGSQIAPVDPVPPIVEPQPIVYNPEGSFHKAYIKGYEDGRFIPSNNLTRTEGAIIIARLDPNFDESADYSIGTDKYSDLHRNNWQASYVGYVTLKGIMQGDLGMFRPKDNMTRGELAYILYKTYKEQIDALPDVNNKSFTDLKNWFYKDCCNTLLRKGLLNGYDDGTFKGQSSITRAEAVTMINNALGRNLASIEHITKSGNTVTFKDVPDDQWYYQAVLAASNSYTDEVENTLDETTSKANDNKAKK